MDAVDELRFLVIAQDQAETNGVWAVSYGDWTVGIDSTIDQFVLECDSLMLGLLEAPAVTLDELERVWPPAEGIKKRRKISSRLARS